eukprot:145510_1
MGNIHTTENVAKDIRNTRTELKHYNQIFTACFQNNDIYDKKWKKDYKEVVGLIDDLEQLNISNSNEMNFSKIKQDKKILLLRWQETKIRYEIYRQKIANNRNNDDYKDESIPNNSMELELNESNKVPQMKTDNDDISAINDDDNKDEMENDVEWDSNNSSNKSNIDKMENDDPLSQNDAPNSESESQERSFTISKICIALGRYYTSLHCEYNDEFSAWCTINGFYDDDVREELEVQDVNECMLLDFDQEFPFEREPKSNKVKQILIFEILTKCYNNPQIIFEPKQNNDDDDDDDDDDNKYENTQDDELYNEIKNLQITTDNNNNSNHPDKAKQKYGLVIFQEYKHLNREELQEKLGVLVEEFGKPFRCPIKKCNLTYSQKSDVHSHMKNKHSNKRKKFLEYKATSPKEYLNSIQQNIHTRIGCIRRIIKKINNPEKIKNNNKKSNEKMKNDPVRYRQKKDNFKK